jgi:hypothetical protein
MARRDPAKGSTMILTTSLAVLLQQERERAIAASYRARLAACFRACCDPTRLDRIVARLLRRSPSCAA